MCEQKPQHPVEQTKAPPVQWLPIVLAWIIVCFIWIGGMVTAINRPLNQQAMVVESPGFLVDINKADRGELRLLPGVGKTLARRIMDYRQAHGLFTSIEQLKQISGIRDKTLNRFREFLLPLQDDPQ